MTGLVDFFFLLRWSCALGRLACRVEEHAAWWLPFIAAFALAGTLPLGT